MWKYKFIYSLSLFSLYGSSMSYLLALWRGFFVEQIIALSACFIFYQLSAHWIYYAKDWIATSIISFLILGLALTFEEPFLSYGLAISFLGATFIQVYLDEMCRSKEE